MGNERIKKYLNPRNFHFWIAVVLIAGGVFRTIQYFGATSLWLDEVTSALNIQERSFYQLATETLAFNQIAPPGFLWTSKIAALLLGETDEAYRLVPWLWSLLSLPMFYLVAKRFLNGYFLLAACLLFSFSIAFYLYAAQAKPYAGDLTVGLLLVWVALYIAEGGRNIKLLWIVALTGFVAILSSFPATPIFFLLTSILIFRLIRTNELWNRKQWLPVFFSWILASAIIIVYSLSMDTQVKSDMSHYWSNGFPPASFGFDYLQWFPHKLYSELNFFLVWWFGDLLPAIRILSVLLLLLTVSCLLLYPRKEKYKLLLLFSPLICALLLAVARQYPFANRVSFYASWPFLVSGMYGLQVLWQKKPAIFKKPIMATIAVLLAIIPVLHTVFIPMLRPPFLGQPMQPVLKELKKQMQPGDILYIYHKAAWATQFYGPREGITDYIVAKSDTAVIPILRDADKLKGKKRVWFVFTQWTEKQPFPDSIKAYLGTVIGKEIGKIPDPFGGEDDLEAAAHLYDLSGDDQK